MLASQALWAEIAVTATNLTPALPANPIVNNPIADHPMVNNLMVNNTADFNGAGPMIADFRPVILVRGFDPLGDVSGTTYYGFNDGTVYPHKMGEDYIYEGMLLKFLKTRFRYPIKENGRITIGGPVMYEDATNVLRYLPVDPSDVNGDQASYDPACLEALREMLAGRADEGTLQTWLRGPVIVDPSVAARYKDKPNTVWVYRYYDFKLRRVEFSARQLQKTIAIVKAITRAPSVNLVCHSMGGLVARYLIQNLYGSKAEATQHIHRWVTLGTPHRGIAFDILPQLGLWELDFFRDKNLQQVFGPDYASIEPFFPANRVLCVVGTNWRSYGVTQASALNQFASWLQGQDQNKSDGLVKQTSAALLGAHKAFVFKCHGGQDSLVTSREAFELATRFFFGDVHASVKLISAQINPAQLQGLQKLAGLVGDARGYYLGFSVKARRTDFFLNRMDGAGENCFGPFSFPAGQAQLLTSQDIRWDETDPQKDGTVFEGFFNSALARPGAEQAVEDLVFRFDTFLDQRDAYLLGHSDTSLVSQQSYFEVRLPPDQPLELWFFPRADAETAIRCSQPDPAQPLYRLALDFDPGSPSFFNPNFQMTLEITLDFSGEPTATEL